MASWLLPVVSSPPCLALLVVLHPLILLPGQLVDPGRGPVSQAIPLCLPININPLVHIVDEEASPALIGLSLLEEHLLGNGMGLRHNPLLMSGG